MSAHRGAFIDLRPFTVSRAFTRMWVGSTLAGLGGQLTLVAVMLHMYALTESTFAVSMIAVAGLIPMVIAGLYGGMLADAFDRRTVALLAAIVTFGSTIVLAALAWSGHTTEASLYILSVINSAANSIVMATRAAIVPRLIPRDLLPAASALQGITVGIMVMAGPALGGVLVALTDYAWTYTIDVALMSFLFLGLWTLPHLPPEGETVKPGLRALADGWTFIRSSPNIRMQYIMDIIAMTFGNPVALFPAVGAVILGGGSVTVGILTASIAAGAFLCSIFSGSLGRVRWQGVGIARSILVFGAATTLFGGVLLLAHFEAFSPGTIDDTHANIVLIVLACVFLAIAGAADNVSAIFRNTMMQAAVPDSMRGRLQGVFTVVVTGGPRLGALYMGTLATIGAIWVPPLLGGLVIIVLIATLLRASASFRAYDARDPKP
ncbi:MFS transporter [Microbacterium sp. NC79]|uniref:MFS transporter n=1 Tax=Microbacterium sp. NC79 TaxID=2851009 RepID=UPI001C2CBE6A|nr:MFS transporter [Microbacterium sp. NC79]MBV0895249.1 MFS transporter [Microbacterium sp. NC79]